MQDELTCLHSDHVYARIRTSGQRIFGIAMGCQVGGALALSCPVLHGGRAQMRGTVYCILCPEAQASASKVRASSLLVCRLVRWPSHDINASHVIGSIVPLRTPRPADRAMLLAAGPERDLMDRFACDAAVDRSLFLRLDSGFWARCSTAQAMRPSSHTPTDSCIPRPRGGNYNALHALVP